MQKEKSFSITLLFVLLLGLLIIFLTAAYSYSKRQERLAVRQRLLCEVLKPGMSKDEVLGVLKQAGEFRVLGGELSEPVFELQITFTDPRGKELYGAFELAFFDYKYGEAYVRNMDAVDVICDFYPPAKPVIETPRSIP